MNFKHIMSLSILLLLLFSTCAASAGTGTVKVLHQNEDGSITDITKDNFEEGDDDDKPHPSDEGNEEPTEEKKRGAVDQEASIKGAQTAFLNALNDYSEGIVNAFYVGAVDLYATDLENEENGTVTYTIHANTVDPYEHPLLLVFQIITFCFLILVTIFVILGSILLQAFNQKYPEKYGEWRRTLSGVYEPYNPKRVHAVCIWSTSRPVYWYSAFIIFIFFRNYIINTNLQTASGVLGSASDSIITRAITGIAMYVSSFQTSVGEFGIYAVGTLIFVVCMITDVLVLKNNKEVAEIIENVLMGAFVLFCFCDMINMGFTSFGVITAQAFENPIFITIGIVSGAFINTVVMFLLTVYVILKGKKQLGV